MANLFGTGINQVPTNGMLGNLAFQDKSFVSVDKIGIGTTATDTGTANQTLQNYGGAYVSGSVGIGTTNPAETLHVLSSTGYGRFENASNTYSVLVRPDSGGPRLYFGAVGNNSFIEFGAYSLVNNLDTKARDLKIFSTAAPNAFTLQQSTGNIGIGTTNPPDVLTVLGKIQIQQDSSSNNRLVFRGTAGSSYRWSIDNFQSGNQLRIFREDDATAASGYVALSINPNGGTVISGVTTVGLANTSTPQVNSQMSFELTSDTNLRIKVRGTDGVLRSANITLS